MITQVYHTDNGGEWEATRQLSLIGALRSLVYYQLGFGGHIVNCSEECLVVRTRVFACIDTVTFSGNYEEMKPLLLACVYHRQVRKSPEEAAEMAMKLFSGHVGLTCWGAGCLFGGILTGKKFLRGVILASLGVEDQEVFNFILDIGCDYHQRYTHGCGYSKDIVDGWIEEDFFASAELLYEGCSLDQLKELVG